MVLTSQQPPIFPIGKLAPVRGEWILLTSRLQALSYKASAYKEFHISP